MPARGFAKPRRTIRLRRAVAIIALLGLAVASWVLFRGTTEREPVARHGARITELTVASDAVGEQLPVNVVRPPGEKARGRGLLVFLHGRSANEGSFLDSELFTALKRLGARAPVVAFPYGGDHSYWHDREDGDWGRYVTGEVIPQVARRFDIDPRRVAIGGISMGGFGAFDIARLHPGRFCAVGGHSPALWATSGETAPGAFDDADDFARHNVIGAARVRPSPYGRQPIWVDAGTRDPFDSGVTAFAEALSSSGVPATVRRWPGGHDHGYWTSHWGDYLRFYAKALRSCPA